MKVQRSRTFGIWKSSMKFFPSNAESQNLKLSRLSFDSLKSSLSKPYVLNPYHFGDEETCKKKVEKKGRKSFNKMSFISGNNKEKLQIESQTYLTGITFDMKAIVLIQTLPIVLNRDQRTDTIPESTLKINSEKRRRNSGLNRTETKTKADEEKSRSHFQGRKMWSAGQWIKCYLARFLHRIDFLCADNITTVFNEYAVSVKVGESAVWFLSCEFPVIITHVWLVVARASHRMWRSSSLLCLQTWVTSSGRVSFLGRWSLRKIHTWCLFQIWPISLRD